MRSARETERAKPRYVKYGPGLRRRIRFDCHRDGNSFVWDGGIVGGRFYRQGNRYFVKGQVRHSFLEAALLSMKFQRDKYVLLRIEVEEYFSHHDRNDDARI